MARKVKAIELVIDWNLWPRFEAGGLDSTNLSRMKEALRNGIELPPIIVNIHDMRVIDGFHRTRAHLDVFGDGAEIYAELRDFANEAEMFLESGRLNANHGLPMTPKDRAHFISKAHKLKIPMGIIAQTLGMSKERLIDFYDGRMNKNQAGEVVILGRGAEELSIKNHPAPLNSKEEHYARVADGAIPIMHISNLISALKAPKSVKFNETVIEKLKILRELIDGILRRAE